MHNQDLDTQLRQITESERFYLNNPGEISPKYKNINKKNVNGQQVYRFEHPRVSQTEIEISKDSRFTSVPLHTHTNVNMNYIYSGSCTYVVDGKEITLNQNDVCIFDTDVIRSKKTIGENDIVINISLSNSFFSNYFLSRLTQQSILTGFILTAISATRQHDNYLIFNTQNSQKIRELFIFTMEEYGSDNLYSRELIDSYLSIIFIELLRIFHANKNKQTIQLSTDKTGEIISIISYIEKNYLTCSLTTLAEKFNYHPKYLSHLIKEKSGKSFKEIQLLQRMKVAATYLTNSAYPIHEIAEKVGFYNKNSFYEKFREHFGMTPKLYRDSNHHG